MDYLANHTEITNRVVREFTGIMPENTMKLVFLRLAKSNLIERIPGRKGYYQSGERFSPFTPWVVLNVWATRQVFFLLAASVSRRSSRARLHCDGTRSLRRCRCRLPALGRLASLSYRTRYARHRAAPRPRQPLKRVLPGR